LGFAPSRIAELSRLVEVDVEGRPGGAVSLAVGMASIFAALPAWALMVVVLQVPFQLSSANRTCFRPGSAAARKAGTVRRQKLERHKRVQDNFSWRGPPMTKVTPGRLVHGGRAGPSPAPRDRDDKTGMFRCISCAQH